MQLRNIPELRESLTSRSAEVKMGQHKSLSLYNMSNSILAQPKYGAITSRSITSPRSKVISIHNSAQITSEILITRFYLDYTEQTWLSCLKPVKDIRAVTKYFLVLWYFVYSQKKSSVCSLLHRLISYFPPKTVERITVLMVLRHTIFDARFPGLRWID